MSCPSLQDYPRFGFCSGYVTTWIRFGSVRVFFFFSASEFLLGSVLWKIRVLMWFFCFRFCLVPISRKCCYCCCWWWWWWCEQEVASWSTQGRLCSSSVSSWHILQWKSASRGQVPLRAWRAQICQERDFSARQYRAGKTTHSVSLYPDVKGFVWRAHTGTFVMSVLSWWQTVQASRTRNSNEKLGTRNLCTSRIQVSRTRNVADDRDDKEFYI